MGGMAAQIPIKNDPSGQRSRRSPRCARTRSARRATATTAPGWRIPASCRSPRKCSTGMMPSPNQLQQAAQDVNVTRDRPAARFRRGTITEAGLRDNVSVGLQYMAAWLGGQRLRADQQPDGRRRHRRNLPRADLAMDPPSDAACSTTAARSPAELFAQLSRGRAGPARSRRSARKAYASGHSKRPPRLLEEITTRARSSRRSSRCRAYQQLQLIPGSLRELASHDSHRTRLRQRLANESALEEASQRAYKAEDVVRLRGTVHVEHSPRAPGRREAVALRARKAVRQCAGRADRATRPCSR